MRLPRLAVSAAVTLVMVMAFMLLGSGTASADEYCDTKVVDTTNGALLDQQQVNDAVQRLEGFGADVRVRAFQAAPYGSLDTYQKQTVNDCPSWQGPDGLTKSNLVVVMFSMDHQDAIFYGSSWHASLDDNAVGIKADYLDPQLKQGNYTQAITGSLDEMGRLFNEQLHPTPPRPTDWSGLLAFLKWFGIAIVTLVVTAVIIWRVRVARRLARKLSGFRQGAVNRKQEADAAYVGLSDNSDVEPAINLATADLNRDDTAALRDQWTAARGLIDAADGTMQDISLRPRQYDPARIRPKSVRAYTDADKRYREALEAIRAAVAAVNAVRERCKEIGRQVEQAPEDHTSLVVRHSALQTRSGKLATAGYRNLPSDDLATVRATLDIVAQHLGNKNPGLAIHDIRAASEQCDAIEARIAFLENVLSTLSSRHQSLCDRLTALTESTDDAGRRYANLCSTMHPACTANVSNQAPGIRSSLAAAEIELAAATADMTMGAQQWDSATQHLDRADGQLQAASDTLDGFNATLGRIAALPETLADKLKAASTALNDAVGKVRGYQGSQGTRKQALAQIGDQLQELQGATDDGQPNYVLLMAQLSALSQTTSDTLSAARHEHNRAEEASRPVTPTYSTPIGGGFGGGFGGGDPGGGVSGTW